MTSLFDFLDDPESIPPKPEQLTQKRATRKAVRKTAARPVKKTVVEPESAAGPPLAESIVPPSSALTPVAPQPQAAAPIEPEGPVTVSQLTLQIKSVLEGGFRDVWVLGQVSNLSQPRSGHLYFTLKDKDAQIPGVLWRSAASQLRFRLEEGMEVVCRGRVEVYPPQGKYQLILSEVEPKGVGTLELAFRQLHERLSREGLFDPARKKRFPSCPNQIALITSSSGAAIRDFLQVLLRRTRRINVLIIPVRVQGEGASAEMAAAIELVNRWSESRPIDGIVLTRGGGSREDLWAFNEEILVRAVAASRIPVASGIGHEIDVSLCDLAADLRALTPSEVAERIAPDDLQTARGLLLLKRRLEDLIDSQLKSKQEWLRRLTNHPVILRPERMIENRRLKIDPLEERLDRIMDHSIETRKKQFAALTAALEAMNPLAVLARGYSLTETETGKLVRQLEDLKTGDLFRTRLQDGTVVGRVLACESAQKNESEYQEEPT